MVNLLNYITVITGVNITCQERGSSETVPLASAIKNTIYSSVRYLNDLKTTLIFDTEGRF